MNIQYIYAKLINNNLYHFYYLSLSNSTIGFMYNHQEYMKTLLIGE